MRQNSKSNVATRTARRRFLAIIATWPLLAAAASVSATDAATATADSEAGEWSTYRGGASRTGVATSAGPTGEPTVLWEFQTDGPIRSEPAVVDGTLYIGSDDGHAYALDAATGQERWRFPAAGAVASSPAVVDGTVYVGSAEGTLYALDANTGSEVWSFPGARDDASVAVVDGVVYAGSNEGQLYALDAGSGAELWSYPLGESSSRSTTVGDGMVLVGSADSRLHAVDAATGTALWEVQFVDGVIGTPVIADGTVYEAVFDGSSNALHAIDAATGEERWEIASETGDNVWVPTIAGDTLYASSDDTNIYAIDAATGEERWRFPTGGRADSGATLAGDTLYSVSWDANLYAIDAATGTELWHLPVGGSAEKGPAIAGGVAYLGTHSGTVVAVGSGGAAGAEAVSTEPTGPGSSVEASTPSDGTSPAGDSELPAGVGPAIGLVSFADEFDGGDEPLRAAGGMAMTPDGRVYVVDMGSDRVVMFDRDGSPLGSWGETGDGPGQFRFGSGVFNDVAVGPDGSVYVGDGNRIHKLTPDGEPITTWGEFGSGDGQFNDPAGILVDSNGDVYVVDLHNARVQVFDSDGTFLRSFGGRDANQGGLEEPFNAALTPDGTVLVTDFGGELLRYDPDGTFLGPVELNVADLPTTSGPFGLVVDEAGNLYIQDFFTNRHWIVDPDGELLAAWGELGSGPGQFVEPNDMAIDPAGGALYIDELNANRVQVFSLDPPLAPPAP